MRISGLQKLSLVDFDGHISATIFTAGCNFACPFCHNKGIVEQTEPIIAERQILEYLEKRKGVLDAVCISGGEPTLYDDLPQFIAKIKDMGYTVKLDTNGTNVAMLKHLVESKLIDYVAMDIKNCLSKYHLTIDKNVAFDVKATVDYILNSGIDYEFRTTLVKQFHTIDNIIEIGHLIKNADKYYLQKFVDGENCLKKGLDFIPKNEAQEFLDALSPLVKSVKLRGY